MTEREIFVAALQRQIPAERTAYLGTACGDDAVLRARVTALLEEHDRLGSFLETPVAPTGPTQPGTDGDVTLDFLAASVDAQSLGRLGNHQITRVIGRGGMGVVLEGRDTRLNRVVAIKVLAPEFASNVTARKRFVREAAAAAAVVHQHVVTIHAIDEDRLPYLVMEFVDGQSLQEKIDREGQLELNEVLRIGVQIASGLAAAHAQGVIHRDIKPANILLENGVERVRITDFGLARAIDDVHITRTGEVAGTPQYMSPEQAQGLPVDGRSDLFSLGCVLYAMCTGRSPFRANSLVAAIRRVCDDVPQPIRELNPDVPEWFTAITDRLLAKRAEDRYQTAGEVADLLGQHLAQVQHPGARPGNLSSPLQGEGTGLRGRARRSWIAAALVLVAVLAGLGVTEATGVTDLAGTVVSIVTGEGTLIIEIDDPAVQVSLDGEELTISGAGIDKFTLRPGQYRFEAVKDGQPVKQELVTVTRGGERVVTVSREAVERTTALPPPANAAGVYVVLAHHNVAERKFDTLADAVLHAGDGATIEIRGNGPFLTEPITVSHSVTIRAGEGYRPIVRLSPQGTQAFDPLLRTAAALVLEGVELQRLGQRQWTDGLMPCIIYSNGPSLHVANCRFRMQGSNMQIGIMFISANCAVRNCEFLGIGSFSVSGNFPPWKARVMENCVHLGTCAHGIMYGTTNHDDADIQLIRNTVVSPGMAILVQEQTVTSLQQEPSLNPISIEASGNVFDCASVLRFDAWADPRLQKNPLVTDVAKTLLKRVLTWRDSANVFRAGGGTLSFLADEHESTEPERLDDWLRFWDEDAGDAIAGSLRYQGGDLLARLRHSPDQITPDDFHLRPDSAGYQAGPDGEDLGADIDLVGPGAAYERWRQSPDYQLWLADTNQVESAQ